MNVNRIGVALLATAGLAYSQTAMPAKSPEFEVASIKPTDRGFNGRSVLMPPNDGMLTMRGWSLKELILFAWGNGMGLHPGLIAGGPSWFDHDRYDIVARATGQRIFSQEERKLMLRVLLIERFQLRFHRESRDVAVYALVTGSKGPKMALRKPDDGGAPFSLRPNGFQLPGRNASMVQLADILQSLIALTDPERDDRPVIDRTGLTERFDFDLKWTPESILIKGRGSVDPPTAPDLFIAVEEQLGLKLQPQKAPMEILVVDRADRPSEN